MMAKQNGTRQYWTTTVEYDKKVKFIKEWERLRFQLTTLERETSVQLYGRQGIQRKQYVQLEEIEISINEELKRERVRIGNHLMKLRTKVQAFQDQLKHVKPTPQFVEKLQENMEEVEAIINDFKEQQREIFESLLTDEQTAEHDIEIIQKRLQTMSSSTSGSKDTGKIVRVVSKTQDSSLPPEVRAFERYIAQHGSQGGWDDYDHGTYLRLRNKYKAMSTFLGSAIENIPGRTEGDIVSHDQWYQRLVELKEAKKAAILEWKLKRDKTSKESADIAPANADEEDELAVREKEKREWDERERKKKEIEDWKKLKAEQAERLERERSDEEARKRRLKEREARKLDDIRAEARDRLREKREEKERERWRMEAEYEQARALRSEEASREIARFRSRDQQVLEERLEERRRKEEEDTLKKVKLEQMKKGGVEILVESDRNRLYRPTDAWLQRKKQKRSDIAGEAPIARMPHRAVPSWRQPL